MRSALVPQRSSAASRFLHACEWVGVVVVPVTAGGIVGGPAGGVVTAAMLVPWLDHLLGRRERSERAYRRDDDLGPAGSHDAAASSRRDRYDSAA